MKKKEVINEKPAEQMVIQEETPKVEEPAPEEVNKSKKELRKEKRYAKLKKKLFKPNDIKYQGPLSYRYLRVLAWIALAVGQLIVINTIASTASDWQPLNQVGQVIVSYASTLSTPFFILASFGLVLSGHRGYKSFLIMYGLAFLGMGLGLCLFYARYINGLFSTLGLNSEDIRMVTEEFISDKIQINVFADLFAFTAFHYFVNYTPKRHFQGKKILIFRLLCLIPVAYVITSYVLKILISFTGFSTTFYVYPFLTTKSPVVFLVFVLISLWIKNREKIFLKMGATKEEYRAFLKTNRNSLSFSKTLSLIIVICVFIELLLLIGMSIGYVASGKEIDEQFFAAINKLGIGQCITMLLAIPFIILYSYTRVHNNKTIDIIIPILGIALFVFVYIEGIFQVVIHAANQAASEKDALSYIVSLLL